MIARVLPTAAVAGSDHVQLTAPERTRWRALRRPGDRADFLAAHLLVRVVAAGLVGCRPEEIVVEQRCEECAGPHGRPRLPAHPEVHLSLAHSAGWVGAVAGYQHCAIDVENTTQLIGLGPRYPGLTAREGDRVRQAPDPAAAFARIWTRKECLVKLSLARLDEVTSVDLEEAPGATGVMFADITGTHPAVASLAWTDPTRRSDGRSRQPSVARRPRRA